MFRSILKYELLYWLKSPLTYFIAVVFFGFTFIMMIGTGGYFDGPQNISQPVRLLNSPFEINFMLQYVTKLLLFIIPVFIGQSIYRDYKSRVYHISYSYPIGKRHYLLGKFLSAFIIVIGISLIIGAAFFLGEVVLGTENAKIAEFRLIGYLQSFGYFLFPNLFFLSIIVFTCVALSRNIYSGFFAILFVFLLQSISTNLFAGHPNLITLFDPLGNRASEYVTRNWNLNDMNKLALPFSKHILFNRIFWMAISSILGYFFYSKFELSHESSFSKIFPKIKRNKSPKETEFNKTKVKKVSQVSQGFSSGNQIKRIFQLSQYDFKFLISNWSFYIFSIAGMLTVFFMLLKITMTGEFNRLPSTWLMLSVPLSLYMLILMLATFLYTGILSNRASTSRMNYMIDASPVNSTTLYFSKLIAIIKLQVIFLLILFLGGIVIQIINGYYDFEIKLYLFHLFILSLPVLIIWAIYSLLIHTIFKNLFVSLFVLVLTWVGVSGLEQIGVDTQLLKFNLSEVTPYSDLNGYGSDLKGQLLVMAYWLSLLPILVCITILFWDRGIKKSIPERMRLAKSRINPRIVFSSILSLCMFGTIGFKIFKEEAKTLSDSEFSKIQKKAFENFEENFKDYQLLEVLKITDVHLELDIYPDENTFSAKGSYIIKNKSDQAIDTVLVKTGFDEKTQFYFTQAFKILEADTFMNHYACLLAHPIEPGGETEFNFEIKNKPNSWFRNNSNIYKNGTMLTADFLPRFGYVFNNDPILPSDTIATKQNFYHPDANLVDIKTIITTSNDQVAIAPGELVQHQIEADRNVFEYKTKAKEKFNFSFHSGSFLKKEFSYLNKKIEVFCHPRHTVNIDSMILGIQSALDYNSKYFSPYPHETFRVIEFPHTRESYSATLMSNNIPTSETLFNVNAAAMADKINLPSYVMSHEITHEWFGNKVMPANTLGAKMLTESLTEYISLRIYKQNAGFLKAKNFLKTQHNRYLKGRSREQKKEHPLYTVRSDQDYIAYGKGAVALNTVAHFIGEEKVNQTLKNLLLEYENNYNHFPTSLEFLKLLDEVTPQKYKYLIEDYFKTILFHNINVISANTQKQGEQYETSIDFHFSKSLEDGNQIPNEDYIEIGFFNEKGELIDLHQLKVTKEKNQISIKSDEAVKRIVLDPNYLLIEKERDDNEYNF